MATTTQHTVTALVFKTEAGPVSYFGNPSRIIHTSRGMFRTLANAGFVYGFENDGGFEGHKVELTLTPAGRVTNIRKLRKFEDGGLRDEVTDYRWGEQDFS